MPTVKGGFGKTPTITVPDAEPPSDLVVKVLSEGDGADVASGDLIVVDYLGVRWDDGATFDSSFDRSPAGFSIGTQRGHPGLGCRTCGSAGRKSCDARDAARPGVRRLAPR